VLGGGCPDDGGGGLGLGSSGAAAEPGSAIRPVRWCAELVRDFDIPGAATHVTTAISGGGGSTGEPQHCDVRGHVEPAAHQVIELLGARWSGARPLRCA
jgi:hypothetical protein